MAKRTISAETEVITPEENKNISDEDILMEEINEPEENEEDTDEEAHETKKSSKASPKPEKAKELHDLKSVTPQIAEKLYKANYRTLESVGVASLMEIMEISGIGDKTAEKIIDEARKALDMGFESADNIYKRRETIDKLTTGSKELDELLGGGLESQSISEVYGKMASGKSQWAFQLAVTAQMPKDKGGLEGNVIYIDSEGSFRPERIANIAIRYDMSPEKVLKNILVARAYNADHQMLLADNAENMIKEKNIRLIIVDSLTSQFRSEYIGRGTLATRQQKLNKHMRQLMKLAESYNTVVFVTNQVMSRPDILFGDPTAPIGGNVVGHASKTRLYLRKGKDDKRIAKLVDSPHLPDGEALYRITSEGIQDSK